MYEGEHILTGFIYALRVFDKTAGVAVPADVTPQPLHRISNDSFAKQLEPKTGKVLARHAVLWRPYTFRFAPDHFYAFTPDGHAYAMTP